ncbi:putative polyprenol reductase [Helianthus annuus]|nr:putative polyprenol reductase [Helianthus annuus]KAJ0446819.1 putative polyprenol reductase [Helianthus annuus]KAJ0631713.1 putative polyprenol reductase [Helianthus annuus]KAJ0635623.1 putative polyprenol reductase [Helianthus annuus]
MLDFVKNLDITELNMLRTKFDIWLLFTPLLRLRWYTWIGAVIFLWGWVHQFRCHVILYKCINLVFRNEALWKIRGGVRLINLVH